MSRLMSINIASLLAAIPRDEDPIIVAGGCDPCQLPFGGRLDDDGEPRYGEATVGDRTAMPSGNAVYSLLEQLGAQPCRLWGSEPPNQCVDSQGCFTGKKVCGAILPYRYATLAAASDYTIKAKKWFWPLLWVDASNANVLVNSIKYQGDDVFENGEGSGALQPSTMFPSDGTNLVPGMPAFDSTNGLTFNVADSAGAGGPVFSGMFIGISIRN